MSIIKSEDQLFDIRLVQRHIQKGKTTDKEYAQYLKGLGDAEQNLDYITNDLIFEELRKEEPEEVEEADLEDSLDDE